jgi:hypothetical protein
MNKQLVGQDKFFKEVFLRFSVFVGGQAGGTFQ